MFELNLLLHLSLTKRNPVSQIFTLQPCLTIKMFRLTLRFHILTRPRRTLLYFIVFFLFLILIYRRLANHSSIVISITDKNLRDRYALYPVMHHPQINNPYAYVTVASSLSELCNALVLFTSLASTGSGAARVLIYRGDHGHESKAIDEVVVNLLRKAELLGVNVEHASSLPPVNKELGRRLGDALREDELGNALAGISKLEKLQHVKMALYLNPNGLLRLPMDDIFTMFDLNALTNNGGVVTTQEYWLKDSTTQMVLFALDAAKSRVFSVNNKNLALPRHPYLLTDEELAAHDHTEYIGTSTARGHGVKEDIMGVLHENKRDENNDWNAWDAFQTARYIAFVREGMAPWNEVDKSVWEANLPICKWGQENKIWDCPERDVLKGLREEGKAARKVCLSLSLRARVW